MHYHLGSERFQQVMVMLARSWLMVCPMGLVYRSLMLRSIDLSEQLSGNFTFLFSGSETFFNPCHSVFTLGDLSWPCWNLPICFFSDPSSYSSGLPTVSSIYSFVMRFLISYFMKLFKCIITLHCKLLASKTFKVLFIFYWLFTAYWRKSTLWNHCLLSNISCQKVNDLHIDIYP